MPRTSFSESVFVLLFCAVLAGCSPAEDTAETAADDEIKLRLEPVAMEALPGYDAPVPDGFAAAMERSCAPMMRRDPAAPYGPNALGGTAADWQPACQSLGQMPVRAWLEDHFQAYRVYDDQKADGLFTGYYEPLLNGSLTPSAEFSTPLYAKPDHLITANLGDFSEDLKGTTLFGKIDGQRFVPFDTRQDIDQGSLDGKVSELVWVDSAIDAFFLHIQGSGSVDLPDGTRIRVGYASQNGRAYYAIGRALIDRGILTRENVSLQSIRGWMEDNPDQATALMQMNPSYIFFHLIEGDGPLGAQGVALTPEVSLAVDRRLFPYGMPVWLDAEDPLQPDTRLQELMVAQDTGGAIRGAVRGDVFWGAGEMAAEKAGQMKSRGGYWVFLPKSIDIPEDYQYTPRPDPKWWERLKFW